MPTTSTTSTVVAKIRAYGAAVRLSVWLLWWLPLAGWAGLTPMPSGLEAMSDSELADVSGQALFVGDRIDPSGAGVGAEPADFTFHRMGLDAELALNANIDKLQLGCGGFNNAIEAGTCDIDMDFVRFMGRNGTSPGDPVTSDFVLTRPYVEIAVQNDDSPTQREVVGIKIGAQSADGFMNVGRDYLTTGSGGFFDSNGEPSGDTNLEHGDVCNDVQGPGAVGCHSGINRISGNIRAELSGTLDISITLAGTSNACFGQTDLGDGQCSGNPKLFKTIQGTRQSVISIPLLELYISGGLADLLADSAYAQVDLNTRMIHGFALEDTSDFFLSFQRQRVAYPNFDASTGSAPAANAGWWMNVPHVKLVDLVAPDQDLGLIEALDALSPPGLPLPNPELGQRAVSNCYGGQLFC